LGLLALGGVAVINLADSKLTPSPNKWYSSFYSSLIGSTTAPQWSNPNYQWSTATTFNPFISGITIGPNMPPVPLLNPEPLPVEKREMPVVGYRGWKWESKFRLGVGIKGLLASWAMGRGWVSTTEEAECSYGQHKAPDQNCGCGLYVVADLDQLESHIQFSDQMVVGAVVGWGKVVQHGREGWRAEHCRILGLLDCKYSEAQLKNTRQAAKEYSLPIFDRVGLERYVKEWGDPFAEPVRA
jgi:hypothetical protein